MMTAMMDWQGFGSHVLTAESTEANFHEPSCWKTKMKNKNAIIRCELKRINYKSRD